MRVLHLFEGIFNVVLGAIGKHDLIVGPGLVVGKEDGLAELDLAEMMEGVLVCGESQVQTLGNRAYLSLENEFHPLGGADFADLILRSLEGGGLSPFDLALAP